MLQTKIFYNTAPTKFAEFAGFPEGAHASPSTSVRHAGGPLGALLGGVEALVARGPAEGSFPASPALTSSKNDTILVGLGTKGLLNYTIFVGLLKDY